MKHKIGYNRLGRKTAHRKAMTRNMLTSLFRHERIQTTKAKALAVRRTAEKMITRAKLDSVHNRRIIGKDIKDSAVLAKMFTDIGPRFKERPGGYTRVLKLGPRASDAAEMVILELLPEEEKPAAKKSSGKGSSKNAAPKASKSKTSEEKSSTKTTKSAKPAEAEAAAEAAPDEVVAPGDPEADAGTETASAAENEPTSFEEKS